MRGNCYGFLKEKVLSIWVYLVQFKDEDYGVGFSNMEYSYITSLRMLRFFSPYPQRYNFPSIFPKNGNEKGILGIVGYKWQDMESIK